MHLTIDPSKDKIEEENREKYIELLKMIDWIVLPFA
jgi:hypothetical protein